MHRLKQASYALAAIVIAIAFAVLLINPASPDRPATSPAAEITVKLAPSAKASVPDQKLTVPAAAVQAVAASDADDHDHSRDETPLGVPTASIEAGREQQDRLAAEDQLPAVAPDAAPVQAGCRSRFVSYGPGQGGPFSSRRGVAPHIIVLHFTVSPNVLGWSDVDGVTAFFARAATQASSNYVIDAEGHCNYIVREVDKAWAQAGYNSSAVSFEVINTGREATYIGAANGPGVAKLARVVHDVAHRWHIPLQTGKVSGCSIVRYGVVTHKDLGACGGGHVDIAPYDPGQVIAAAKALDGPAVKPVTSVDRVTCRKLNYWRTHGRRHGLGERRAIRRRSALGRRGVTCASTGPVRR